MALELAAIPAVSGAVNVALDTLVKESISYFRNRSHKGALDPTVWRLKLRTTMLALSMLVDHAKVQHITSPAMLQWLDELTDVIHDAEDLEDAIETEELRVRVMAESAMLPATEDVDHDQVLHNSSSSSSLSSADQLTVKLVSICEKMDVFLPQINLLSLVEPLFTEKLTAPLFLPVPAVSLSSHQPSLVGRDSQREEVISFLLGQTCNNMCVIAVTGGLGLGKTALVKMVFDDPRVKGSFDLNIWVSVSSSATSMGIDGITKAIFKSVTRKNVLGDDHFKTIQGRLSEALLGKSLLVVLDDIQEMEPKLWDELLCPLRRGGKRFAVIVTADNDTVASQISADCKIQINPLSDEDCFSVLETATKIGNEALIDGAVGKQIAVKCKGSPLAARLIGSNLGFMLNMKGWHDALRSKWWDRPCGKFDIPPSLRLSYWCLTPHLKKCFAYCSIFPKNYEIQRKRLVLLWIAQGFVQASEGNRDTSLDEMGDEYFHELLCRSFFQPSLSNDSNFVMHNLVHDLAREVSSDFCFTLDTRNPQLPPSKARHFSYTQTKNEDFKYFKAMNRHVQFEKLRTFLPLGSSAHSLYGLNDEETEFLITKLVSLRALSLAHYAIQDLPQSLSGLQHLRFLDLQHTNINHLPEVVCTLYNLQTLLLGDCPLLTTLPEWLGNLLCLRHLDISGAHNLQNMPLQIKKLNKMSTLTNFVVGENKGAKISALGDFDNLRGHLTVSGLQNVTCESDASYAKMKTKLYIDELTLKWSCQNQSSEMAKRVCQMLQPSKYLKKIAIRAYIGASFPGWVGARTFADIVSVDMADCSKCTCLPALGQLPSLKQLCITNFSALESVALEVYGCSIQPFQALEVLRLKNMPRWRTWSAYQFPKLQELYLCNCPNLLEYLPVRLPSLLILEVINCGHLTSSLPRLPTITKLKLHDCPKLNLTSIAHFTTLTSLDIRSTDSGALSDGLNLQNLHVLRDLKMEHTKTDQNSMIIADNGNSARINLSRRDTMLIGDGLQNLSIHNCAFHMVCPTTSLISLSISRCRSLELNAEACLFSSLQSLELNQCDSMESFPSQLFPSLIHLKIEGCSRLKEISVPNGTKLQYLYQLSITSCKQLLQFPSQGLSAPNLTTFSIRNCDMLEYLPCKMDSLLPSLRLLQLTKCPVLKPSPTDALLPPNVHVDIRSCALLKDPARQWNGSNSVEIDIVE